MIYCGPFINERFETLNMWSLHHSLRDGPFDVGRGIHKQIVNIFSTNVNF